LTCREFVEFLMRYLEGELDPEVSSAFEGHMGACPQCVWYLDTYRETVRLGRELLCESPDAQVPADVPEELVAAILAARRASRRS
jgi:anti-sigma factor RsiW